MTVNRGRGWRRIGIVLSVIWFVAFGGYLCASALERTNQSFGGLLELCTLVLNADNTSLQFIANQEERAQKQTEYWAKYDECWTRASRIFRESRDEVWKETVPILLAFDAGTVGFGWLVVWLVILVGRWVQRGFASA
jgi:hypothetical protein